MLGLNFLFLNFTDLGYLGPVIAVGSSSFLWPVALILYARHVGEWEKFWAVSVFALKSFDWTVLTMSSTKGLVPTGSVPAGASGASGNSGHAANVSGVVVL